MVFGVITDNKLYLWRLKNAKKNAVLFKLFWYKVFVYWKLKLLNFRMDSILIRFITGRPGGHENDPIYSLSIYARFSGQFLFKLS